MSAFSFEKISTKEFLGGMVKGVLGTHYLQPDKFPLFYTDPPVGRSFVADRLKKEYPIDQRAAEKLYVLYKFILEGESNYELVPLTARFSKQFSSLLGMDIEFLRLYDDDTEEMKEKKGGYLLMLWKDVVDRFIDKSSVPLDQFRNNRFALLREIFMKMKTVCKENTYTDDVMKRWEERTGFKSVRKESEKHSFAPFAVPLFIYGYAGTMEQPFLSALLERSQYMFELGRTVTDRTYQPHHNVRLLQSETLFVSQDEFDEKESRNELFHIRTYQMEERFREAYSMVLIENTLAEGISTCIPGSLEDLQIIRGVFPYTQSVLVLPKNVERAIRDLGERQSDPGAVVKHFRYLNQTVKKIMEEDKNVLVFFADSEDMPEVVSAVESNLLLVQHSLEYNREALKRYTRQVTKSLSTMIY